MAENTQAPSPTHTHRVGPTMAQLGLQEGAVGPAPLWCPGPDCAFQGSGCWRPADLPGRGSSSGRAHAARSRAERGAAEVGTSSAVGTSRAWTDCAVCEWHLPLVIGTGLSTGYVGTCEGTRGSRVCVLGGCWACKGACMCSQSTSV